ncbi:hypothetical protein [Bradyrhizobium betae]|uniref:Uncharacterized protein n=1 Tax=Bradyrhizobium betae TaxID=244734 RepID=A0A5P6P859_9BRAD|nr:hypothetical protein [Bradyrhizobium betae]MCS3729145.1 hypothetical protein [Bradyrhizobium betae]QFI74491.1 hypothetical protein F8237_20010 [Bradyrhizobium betae]
MTDWLRMSICIGAVAVVASVALGSSARAAEGDVQWRVSDQDHSALLVTADSEATDNLGPLLFHCKKGSGRATAEGDMSEDARSAIAATMLHDEEPNLVVTPEDASAFGPEFFTGMNGWRYRFQLSVTGPAFEQFERTGGFRFKLGDSSVSSDFKLGLENIRKFQELCKRPAT